MREEEGEQQKETNLEKNTTLEEEEISPYYGRLSIEPTKKEETVALATLSTPIKSTKKRQRKTPLYLKIRRSIRINKGKPQKPVFQLKNHHVNRSIYNPWECQLRNSHH